MQHRSHLATAPEPLGYTTVRACFGYSTGATWRSKWLLAPAQVPLVHSKMLFEPASAPPVRSQVLKPAVQDPYPKLLVSVTPFSEPLYSALLCAVHVYARVHTSIYIYIYHMLYYCHTFMEEVLKS